MKKFLFVIITALTAVTSYGQGGQPFDICYDINCIYVPPGGSGCPKPLQIPPGCIISPVQPFNCPIVCREVIIENELQCDLDFWWDYTTTAPCGDIVPAYWACPWIGYSYCPPYNPLIWPVPLGTPLPSFLVCIPNSKQTIQAYELKWPSCVIGDNPTACYCPDYVIKWRMDVNLIANASTAPLQPTLLGSSFTFMSTSGSISYYVATFPDCTGATFYVDFDSALDSYYFHY